MTSQALRDPDAVSPPLQASPEALVQDALRQGAKVLVSTYNEPLITSEWAVAIFKQARAAGLVTGFVSNGNGTPQVLEYIRPWVDLYKVDLKSFDDRHYHELGGRIGPILETIRGLHEMGVWLEIVTLLIPGFNDSDDELKGLTDFLAGVSPDIPWHVTAFHKDYKMDDPDNTGPSDLLRAAEIGRKAGLRYVYAGNLPGRVGDLEDTRCHQCGETLIRRRGYFVQDYRVTSDGQVPVLPDSDSGPLGGQISRTRSPIVLSCRAEARVWLQSPARMRRTAGGLHFRGCLCLTVACSPRDFLTRRLATDLIAGSETFKTTQLFWLRTGVISNKDYTSPEYVVLRRHGWITGNNAACPPELAPAPCWDMVITPLGVDALRDWVAATAASSQYISVPVAQRELLALSGIRKNGNFADVDFQWRWAAVNEVGAALYAKGTEYNSTVGFVHYDDGWRVIEGGSLKSSQGLSDALKNTAPAQ